MPAEAAENLGNNVEAKDDFFYYFGFGSNLLTERIHVQASILEGRGIGSGVARKGTLVIHPLNESVP